MLADEKFVNAVETAGAALQRHEQFYREKQAEAQAVEAEIPATVDALLKRGMIEPSQRDMTVEALKDPKKAVILLRKAAMFVSTEDQTRLGEQVPASGQNKSGSANGNGYRGGRKDGSESPAWTACSRALGL